MQARIEACYNSYLRLRMNLRAENLDPLVVLQLTDLEQLLREALDASLCAAGGPSGTVQLQTALDNAVQRIIQLKDEVSALQRNNQALQKQVLDSGVRVGDYQAAMLSAQRNAQQLVDENAKLRGEAAAREQLILELQGQVSRMTLQNELQAKQHEATILSLRNTVENVVPQQIRSKDHELNQLRDQVAQLTAAHGRALDECRNAASGLGAALQQNQLLLGENQALRLQATSQWSHSE